MGAKDYQINGYGHKALKGKWPSDTQNVHYKVNAEMVDNPINKWAHDIYPVGGSPGEALHPSLLQNQIITKFLKVKMHHEAKKLLRIVKVIGQPQDKS